MVPDYPSLNKLETGKRIQKYMLYSNVTVKEVQEYLHLSCPQSIYRWLKGMALPSIDHFYALACLFHCKIEDLLATNKEINPVQFRMYAYLRALA